MNETGAKTYSLSPCSLADVQGDMHVRNKIFARTLVIACRACFPAWTIGIFLCASVATANERNLVEFPQIFNAEGQSLGTYGGLMQVSGTRGETLSAFAVISSSGYLVPMTPQGEIGHFRSAFYSEEGCDGDEYLSPVADHRTTAPLAGLVYRSLATAEVRFVPHESPVTAVNVRSRMFFDDQNRLLCEDIERVIEVLPSKQNDPSVTAFATNPKEQSAISIRMQRSADRQVRSFAQHIRETGSIERSNGSAQQECSPGCFVEDSGNGICEISCYVEACYFDGGDCDNESDEFLEQELAQMCSPGCFLDDLADAFCDQACNNSACEFDRGDCDP